MCLPIFPSSLHFVNNFIVVTKFYRSYCKLFQVSKFRTNSNVNEILAFWCLG
jgi:hypothetical protein